MDAGILLVYLVPTIENLGNESKKFMLPSVPLPFLQGD
jgi:hypothetical protein